MIDDLLLELSRLDNVDAICLGGSRANNVYDTKSDYDIYVYINSDIDDDIRANILIIRKSVIITGNWKIMLF